MAGGSGTRFWPASHKKHPKQYLNLLGKESLIQATHARLCNLVGPENIFICTTHDQVHLIQEQLPQFPIARLILEPIGKNTAACVALSTVTLLQKGFAPDTAVLIAPADHHIGDEKSFLSLAKSALAAAPKLGGLFTFGIKPDYPHTGYGYIEAVDALPAPNTAFRTIKRFVEKPSAPTATDYVRLGTFYWNSGIFVWTLETIRNAFREHQSALYGAIEAAVPATLPTVYAGLDSVPVDVAIMEKVKNGFVLPASMKWSDLGSWSAVHEARAKSPTDTVVLAGEAKTWESEGCLIRCPNKNVAVIGAPNLIIVEDGDNLLIVNRASDQLVREAAKKFDVLP